MTDADTPNIDPQHAVLLVMDYQSGIVSRVPDPNLRCSREPPELVLRHGSQRVRAVSTGVVALHLSDEPHPDTYFDFPIS
jgi:hypothetical protein